MRITTANRFDIGIDNLTRRQSEMSELQNQISSGKRVNRASDDPAGAARAERALASLSHTANSQRAVDASKVAMLQTESALGDAASLLQRARELMVSAGNPSYTDQDRKSIAGELTSIRQALVEIANLDNGSGTYLFGGQGATQKPFVDNASGIQYAAVAGQTLTEPSTGLPLSTDGRAVWMSARTGNGVFVTSAQPGVTDATINGGTVVDPTALTGADYSVRFTVSGGVTTYAILQAGAPTSVVADPYVSGRAIVVDGMSFAVSGTPADTDQFEIAPSTSTLSVFDTLDRAATALAGSGRTGAQIAQSNAEGLRSLDSVMAGLQGARAAAGQVLNRIDNQSEQLANQRLAGQTARSDAEDVDLVHAISDFQQKQTGYDAALKSYAMVQRLSLFQYVNGN